MKMNEKIKQKILLLPHSPGIYQFFDAQNKIIYIGKAKDLKNRVASYFLNRVSANNLKLRTMVTKIVDIKHIVLATESDAFFLENILIKKYQPRYNILLKDDKTYPWICVKKENFPRLLVVRHRQNDGSKYFGPYSYVSSIRFLLDLIKRLYTLRTCNLHLTPTSIARKKYKPCLEYHIGNCKAPCIGNQTEYEYDLQIEQVLSILKGDIQYVLRYLRNEMDKATVEYRFEDAQLLKERYNRLETYQSKSVIVSSVIKTADVITIFVESTMGFANFMRILNGAIVLSQTFELSLGIEDTRESLLNYVVADMIDRLGDLSFEIIVPFKPDFEFPNHVFTIPNRGDKLKLLELSFRNLRTYQFERLKQIQIIDSDRYAIRVLSKLQKALKLATLPRHIECFDNSNINGTNPVASCVVFKNGKPSKKDYRKYNIKTVVGANDYASMREVVWRRYSKFITENIDMPDLIITDGGRGQMEIVRRVIKDELNLNIPVAGLTKDKYHQTNELLFGFPPVQIGIKPTDPYFKLLAAIQNETHRVAIEFHRDKRSKAMTGTQLTDIRGIGEKTAQKLLVKFKTLSRIKAATVSELYEIIGEKKTKNLLNYFAKKNNKNIV
ncbi:MAG: excinuclease ABC subunit UvrC [Prevotellaceae bacterium]|jgi:excinuclease ABC subunit C|nr:excinuclease ABC subunit UvrC [Prevotellaceae bacterium]